MTEFDYFAAQSEGLQGIVILGNVLSIAMALGALSGALNTMYQSVNSRAREIATLRVIGFSGQATFIGTLFESLILAAFGGLIGALGAYALFDGISASTLGASFTQVVFRFDFSLDQALEALVLAMVIGVIGGAFPAWRAASMPVLRAFR